MMRKEFSDKRMRLTYTQHYHYGTFALDSKNIHEPSVMQAIKEFVITHFSDSDAVPNARASVGAFLTQFIKKQYRPAGAECHGLITVAEILQTELSSSELDPRDRVILEKMQALIPEDIQRRLGDERRSCHR